jgi:maleamate amidohydrolase
MTGGAADFEDHCWRDVISPDIVEIYRPYRRETYVRGNVALLAIDLFAAVFPEYPMPVSEAVKTNRRSCGEFAWDARPVIGRLLNLARARGLPLAFSSADLGESSQGLARATQRPRRSDDAASVAIYREFRPLASEPLILKPRASVFFETELLSYLRGHAIETLVLCGESTSGCVRATAVDGYSHGFHVVVIEDAVFDRSELSHKVSLFDLHHKYADVMVLEEFEEKLRLNVGSV